MPHKIARRRALQDWQNNKRGVASRLAASTTPLGFCSGVSDLPDRIQVLTLHGDSIRDIGFIDLPRNWPGSRFVEDAYNFHSTFALAVAEAIASRENIDRIGFGRTCCVRVSLDV